MELKKHIENKDTGIGYTLVGDYYIPDLKLPEMENFSLGKYGMARLNFLKTNRKYTYQTMLIDGTLNRLLHETEEQCKEMFARLTDKYAKAEGVTEALKAADPMEWVRRMNGIRERVDEVIFADFINV